MTRFAGMIAALGMAAALALVPGTAARAQSTLNCKGCVDTKDLAKNAVTSSRLKKAAVKTNRFKDRAVTGPKIGAGAVDTGKLAAGAVAGDKLAPGAVTGAKIAAGAVTGDKLDPALLDSLTSLTRTIVVNPVGDGTDFAANGQALLDAVAAFDTVTPAPGADTPWLLKIEAGVYDVGATSVDMRQFVDIEGAGQDVTTIRGDTAFAVVNGANDAELRSLRVEHQGGAASNGNAIDTLNSDMRITDVTATAINNTGASVGIRAWGDSVLTNVTATGERGTGNLGIGVWVVNNGSDVQLVNSTVIGSGDASASASLRVSNTSVVTVRNSVIKGIGQPAVRLDGMAPSAFFVSTQLDGFFLDIAAGATAVCVGAYDGAFTPLPATCLASFSGSWSLFPAPSYSCATGAVSLSIGAVTITDTNPGIVIATGNPSAGTLNGTFSSSTNFSASRFVGGTCAETYAMTGTFADASTFFANFTATFSETFPGACFDCTNQSWSVTGTR